MSHQLMEMNAVAGDPTLALHEMEFQLEADPDFASAVREIDAAFDGANSAETALAVTTMTKGNGYSESGWAKSGN